MNTNRCLGCLMIIVGDALLLWALIAGGKVLLDNWRRINVATNWGASTVAVILLVLCMAVIWIARRWSHAR